MNISRRWFLGVSGGTAASIGLNYLTNQEVYANATSSGIEHPWFAPVIPAYPNFVNRASVIAEAQQISDNLEAYIRNWLNGGVSAQIPDALLPQGIDSKEFKDFFLQRAEDVTPEQQWGIRLAEEIDFKGLRGYFPDPHCTYLVIGNFFAPFGTKVVIEGEFPHCRFFDIQATPSFQPEDYHYNGAIGVGEVPIVDVDIDPLPGHVNPFRVGADRTAPNRRYRVTFDLAIGNPTELNSAFNPPYYRAPGNHRQAGAILYQGPWGENQQNGHGRGLWDMGQLWIRYYAPDFNQGPLAGVPLPKVHYQLPDGRTYYVNADWSRWVERSNRKVAARFTFPEDPPQSQGPSEGWAKQFGIFRAIVSGIAKETQLVGKDYVRALDKGVAGRGEDLPAPGNLEPSATTCTYINYLLRGMSLGWGKVVVLTGKLPVTPRTRRGESRMEAGEARYWSLTGYDPNFPLSDGYCGAAVHSIMDDEIVLDGDRRYVIALSSSLARPENAIPQNGVTWIDWGPTARLGWTLRWLSVHPEWSFPIAPNETNLPWATDWASVNYNKNLIGNNTHSGFLREYLPQVHYLTKEQFEKLGAPITASQIPIWR